MEKEVKKSSTLIVVIITILGTLVAVLSGYILYDKVLKEPANTVTTDNSNVSKSEEENNNSTEEQNTTKEVTKVTNEEALQIGNNLWAYAVSAFWGSETAWARTADHQCATSIQEVKSHFTTDFTAELVIGSPVNIDGFIAKIPCETAAYRGSNINYIDTKIGIKEIKEDEIIFTANSQYKDGTQTLKDFIVKKVDNNWLIHYFYLPM